MIIYLICNNLTDNDIIYENMDIDDKKLIRPLSIEGETFAKNIKISDEIENIYTGSNNASLETAKYISYNLDKNIIVNTNLNDCKVGDLNKKNIKMLSYLSEHNFDYKLSYGESLNECAIRIENEIKKIIKTKLNSIVILPKRSILSFLIKYTKQEFNMDDRLILVYNDKIILSDFEGSIIKLKIENEKIKDITEI